MTILVVGCAADIVAALEYGFALARHAAGSGITLAALTPTTVIATDLGVAGRCAVA